MKKGGDGSGGRGRPAADPLARQLAGAAIALWGNLVSVIIETLVQADVPRRRIHDVLDRLDDENRTTMAADEAEVALAITATIRQRLPGND